MVRAIGEREASESPAVTDMPMDVRLSRAILVLILSFLCVLVAVILIILGTTLEDDKNHAKVISGGLFLAFGIIFIVIGAIMYHQAYQEKLALQKLDKSRYATQTGRDVADNGSVVSEARTTQSELSESDVYPRGIGPAVNASFETDHEALDIRYGYWSDHSSRTSISSTSDGTEGPEPRRASTMRLSDQAMRMRHTPPSPEPVQSTPPALHTGLGPYDPNGGDFSDITSEVTSFNSAQEDLAILTDDTESFKEASEDMPSASIGVRAASPSSEDEVRPSRRSVHFDDDLAQNGHDNSAYA